jgi:hypothetical protein
VVGGTLAIIAKAVERAGDGLDVELAARGPERQLQVVDRLTAERIGR